MGFKPHLSIVPATPASSNFPAMTEALAWLYELGVPHQQVSPYQIKIGRTLSWYPTTGTIFLDGAKHRHPRVGRLALLALLQHHQHDL